MLVPTLGRQQKQTLLFLQERLMLLIQEALVAQHGQALTVFKQALGRLALTHVGREEAPTDDDPVECRHRQQAEVIVSLLLRMKVWKSQKNGPTRN